MENNRRNDRYRNDSRSELNERNSDMNWDRNYNPDDEYRDYPNRNQNVYSSDREREYWNSENRMNDRYPGWDYNGHQYSSRNQYSTYNYNHDANNRPYNDFRNQRYNDRYDTIQGMNNYRDRSDGRYRDNYQHKDWYDTNRGWWDKTKDEVASWFGDDDAERRRHMDEMRSGQHRGKGPKNYTRSEERIREDVSDQLCDDSFLDASGIEVSVKDGEVTLNGEVDSRYSKHRAEDLAEDVTGVKNVQNNLRVVENSQNTIYKDSANNGNRPITTNTNYVTTKNRKDFVNG